MKIIHLHLLLLLGTQLISCSLVPQEPLSKIKPKMTKPAKKFYDGQALPQPQVATITSRGTQVQVLDIDGIKEPFASEIASMNGIITSDAQVKPGVHTVTYRVIVPNFEMLEQVKYGLAIPRLRTTWVNGNPVRVNFHAEAGHYYRPNFKRPRMDDLGQ